MKQAGNTSPTAVPLYASYPPTLAEKQAAAKAFTRDMMAGLTFQSVHTPPTYNPANDIPTKVVDFATGNNGKAFARLDDAIMAAGPNGSVRVDRDCTLVGPVAAPAAIYFAPNPSALLNNSAANRIPTVTYAGGEIGRGTPAAMYLVNGDCTVYGGRFVGFGEVFACATPSPANYAIFGDSSNPGFERGVPHGTNATHNRVGVGIAVDPVKYPANAQTTGPGLRLHHTKFVNCQGVCYYLSDTMKSGPIEFHGIELEGSWNMLDLHVTLVGDVHITRSLHHSVLGERMAPGNWNTQRYHTSIKIGINNSDNITGCTSEIVIEGNDLFDIEDNLHVDTLNAAVGVDIRGVRPSWFIGTPGGMDYRCSISVSYNRIKHLWNLVGAEDANAYYGKLHAIMMIGNDTDDCGSGWAKDGGQDGTEGSGNVRKEPYGDWTGLQYGDTCLDIWNKYRNMPAVRGNLPNAKVVENANPPMPVVSAENDYINCPYLRPNGGHDTMGGIQRITDNEFVTRTATGYCANGVLTYSASSGNPWRTGMVVAVPGAGSAIIKGVASGRLILDKPLSAGSPDKPVRFVQTVMRDLGRNRFFDCPTNGMWITLHDMPGQFNPGVDLAGNQIICDGDWQPSGAVDMVATDHGTKGMRRTPPSVVITKKGTFLARVGSDDNQAVGQLAMPERPTLSRQGVYDDSWASGKTVPAPAPTPPAPQPPASTPVPPRPVPDPVPAGKPTIAIVGKAPATKYPRGATYPGMTLQTSGGALPFSVSKKGSTPPGFVISVDAKDPTVLHVAPFKLPATKAKFKGINVQIRDAAGATAQLSGTIEIDVTG